MKTLEIKKFNKKQILPQLPIKLNNNNNKIKKAIQKISLYLKDKGIQEWKDYELYSFNFKKAIDKEDLLELIFNKIKEKKGRITKEIKIEKFNCYIINEEEEAMNVEGIQLFYGSYEGWVGLKLLGKGFEDSLLEISFNEIDDYMLGEKANIEFDNNPFIQTILFVWSILTNYKKKTYKRNIGI